MAENNALRVIARLRQIGPALVFGVSFLALWEAAVRGFDLKPYFLAAPSKIFEQFLRIIRAFGMHQWFQVAMPSLDCSLAPYSVWR